jgi:hypothetical protein
MVYGQDKVKYDTPELSVWHNKVGDDTGYTYTACLHEVAIDRRDNTIEGPAPS